MILVSLLAFQSANAIQAKVNPMRKIISMLQDMQKELEREGELEKEIFDKAICACEGGEAELDKVIADSSAVIDEKTAEIGSKTAETTQLTQDVATHKSDAKQAEADLSEATTIRDKEHKAFLAEQADSKTNIAALGKAIPAIEKGMGGAALMQMSGQGKKMEHLRRFVEVTKLLSNDERSGVLAFLSSDDQQGENSQSGASGEILGILKNMKDEMEKDLSELQAQEKKDFEGFNDLKAAKTSEISINEKSVITKDKRMGALALELSEAKHALEDATEEKANAEKFKANMKEQCATVEKDQAMRAKMRSEEIAAISEAVGILNDDDALETFSKAKSAALVQEPKATYDALIQLISHHAPASQVRRHITLLALDQKTKHKHKREEPAAPADAAEELVTHMVTGMIGVLHDEDVSDEHKKGWCANETEVAHGIEAEKKTLIQETTSEIAEQEDLLAQTVAEIKALTEHIAATDKMVHEATEQRKSEHEEFTDSFATSATAIRLIDKAIKRLEKFYSPEKVAKEVAAVKEAALAKAGLSLLHKQSGPSKAQLQATAARLLPGGFDFDALIQTHAQTESMSRFTLAVKNGVDPIVIPSTPKTYEKKESGGVMALMNEFITDLKLDMTESETNEKFMAKEYVRVMTDAKASRDQDVKSKANKVEAKATLDQKLVDNKALLALTEEQLHNLELYLVQLHTECDFLVRNYEARHEGRIDEETGLEDAATIVTGEETPDHREIEKRYKEEHTDDDVDEHFPDTPIDDGPDAPAL